MNQKHFFHITFLSPWPLLTALITWNLFTIFILFLAKLNNFTPVFILLILITRFIWWRDVNRERCIQGFHTRMVTSNIRYGIILFIVSEIMFFLRFFWGFFHSSLRPSIEISVEWPPQVQSINPFDVPLLNTIILLSSGITITLRHHYLLINDFLKRKYLLLVTIILGVYFSAAQIFEYWDSQFNISDSSFSSCFFVATGFHGFHVVLGTIFILRAYLRIKLMYFSQFHHTGIENRIWYWHFVDVVWLFLFTFLYWWSF